MDSLFLGLKQEKSRLYPHGVQVSTYKWPSSTDTAQFAADHLAFIKEVEAHIRNSEGKKPSEISLPWEEMRVQSRLPFFFDGQFPGQTGEYPSTTRRTGG